MEDDKYDKEMRERERSRERGSVHPSSVTKELDQPSENPNPSKEEEDLRDRNTKKTFEDIAMEEVQAKEEGKSNQQESDKKEGPVINEKMTGRERVQISYKEKLLGAEKNTEYEQDFESQMREWLKEEEETAPILTEEQAKLFECLPKLDVSDERLKNLCKPWKDSIIITLLGRFTSREVIRDRLQWILKAKNFDLVDMPNNFFTFRTNDTELCKKLLFEGPWVIQGHYLAVQRWSPNFNPYCNIMRKVAIWVRIPNLPLHFYSEQCMWEIGNMIGKALKVDLNTLAHVNNNSLKVERGKFARVSVEIDLSKPLQSRFVLRKKIFTVEYEGLDIICFNCGKYGHNQEKCPMKTPEQQEMEAESTNNGKYTPPENSSEIPVKQPIFSSPMGVETEKFGEWMQAKRTFRRKTTKGEGEQSQKPVLGGSKKANVTSLKSSPTARFDVLYEDDQAEFPKDMKEAVKNNGKGKVWRRKEDVTHESTKEKMGGSNHVNQGKSKERREKEDGSKDKMDKARNSTVTVEMVEEKEKVNAKKSSVDPPQVINNSKSTREGEKVCQVGKKRAQITRPKITSPILKRKLASRAHKIVIGSATIQEAQVSTNTSVDTGPQAKIINLQDQLNNSLAQQPTQMEKHQRTYGSAATNEREHKKIEDQFVISPKKPPDPSIVVKTLQFDRENNEMNDLWFETHDEVAEVCLDDEDATMTNTEEN